jgi:hypothetical protein
MHLVLDGVVDRWYTFDELPAGTVSARDADALAIAVADPTAVLVTADGYFIGSAASGDERWHRLVTLGRSRGRLGSNALSGRYYGLVVEGPMAARYRDGVREKLVSVEAQLAYPDGIVVRIERTTLDVILRREDKVTRYDSLRDALRWTEASPHEVTSEVYVAAELAALLDDAGRLAPRVLLLNGTAW